MSNKLYILRHAESVWNNENRFTGFFDSPLSANGIKQAEQLREQLKDIKFFRCISSTLSRAYETAKIVSGMQVDKNAFLRERDYGKLTGMNKDEAVKIYGQDKVTFWRRHPEGRPELGESLLDIIEYRANMVLEGIILPGLHNGNILVVSHGNFIRAFLVACGGVSIDDIANVEIKKCSPIIFNYNSELRTIELETKL